jgi:hypothetical protein
MTDDLSINNGIFSDEFGFVSKGNSNKKGILIAFSVLCGVFLILGLVATVFYCMRKRQGRFDNQEERISSEDNMDSSEKKYNKLLS